MSKSGVIVIISYVILIINFILMSLDVVPDVFYSGNWNLMSRETSRIVNLWITGGCITLSTIGALLYYLVYGRCNDDG